MKRDYHKELNIIYTDVENELNETIKKVFELNILEEIGEGTYKLPNIIGVDHEFSEELFGADTIVKEGTVYPNGVVVPEMGLLYGEHYKFEEVTINEMTVYGMIDLLEGLEEILKENE
jgi:hypothetical protein